MPPIIDLTGQRFGKLTVMERAPNQRTKTMWRCRCDCGGSTVVSRDNLRSGHTKACGCLGGRFIDLKGKRLGRLSVIAQLANKATRLGDKKVMWLCLCDCGKLIPVRASNLQSGNTKSCGCLQRERTSEARLIDLTGQRFGSLTVIARAEYRNGKGQWLCTCTCGSDKVVEAGNLRSGHTQSCGCLQKERASETSLEHLSGREFGRLTVLERVLDSRYTVWACACRCGGFTRVAAKHLTSGAIESCGCLRRETSSQRSGANHPSWRPDLTEEERARKRNEHKNRIWRFAVYERDDFTCQVCWKRGGKLNAHHLKAYSKYRALRFDVKNGVTLCEECHQLFHSLYSRGHNTMEQYADFNRTFRHCCARVS